MRLTPYALKFFADRNGLTIFGQQSAGDGTVVIGTSVAFVRPMPRTSSILGRLAACACDSSRKAAFVLLRSRLFRHYIKGQDQFYLANIVVMERSATD
jgi:hypothetical protein